MTNRAALEKLKRKEKNDYGYDDYNHGYDCGYNAAIDACIAALGDGVLKELVEIERRDSLNDPDLMVTDEYRSSVWQRAKKVVGE